MTVQAEPIKKQTTYRREMYQRAIWESFVKLDPRVEVRNPVMFVVEVGAIITTVLWVQAVLGQGEAPASFIAAVSLWLWFTVLFANFAEAVAEGRGKAQAASLRKMRQESTARRLVGGKEEAVPASQLRKGDVVVIEANQLVPGDGEIIEGI